MGLAQAFLPPVLFDPCTKRTSGTLNNGEDSEHNLVTLCSNCHADVHR